MPTREATIIVGLLALVWLPAVPLPSWLGRAASVVASASLFVYLTHFVVFPHVMAISSPLAMACSLAVGIAYWQLWTRVEAGARSLPAALRRVAATRR